jgi:DNA-nicking Smr family endonuclease
VAKKEKPFNNPFGAVKLPPKPAPPAAKPAPPKVEPQDARAKGQPKAALTEEELWTLAVDGAAPLVDRSARIRPDPQPLSLVPQHLDPDLAAYDELRALVTGEVPFDIADSDEFIEGHSRGLDQGVVRKLRRGDFSVQAHLDLHGLLKDEAKAELEAFLVRCRQQAKRCVLIVTGRGLHSKDQVPVLKEALKRWMLTDRFARHVLAFASARPHDGGSGAVYVLLRRT